MKTRELAVELRIFADYLDSRPEFNNGTLIFFPKTTYGEQSMYLNYGDKSQFVEAVRALGSSTKKYTGDSDYAELKVRAKDYPLEIAISRDKVCRKVVKFECDPLFSEEEFEAL
jgi:hypothetical protein